MSKFFFLIFMAACLNAHADMAYLSACEAVIFTPSYGECRDLTDKEIEEVSKDTQPGCGYWQTWDVNIPKDKIK